MLALVAFALAGCIEGEPIFFEDRSVDVVAVRVNAWADGGQRVAKAEVYGLASDGANRAFSGTLRIVLEAQDDTSGVPVYTFLQEWEVRPRAEDFATPTVPFYTHLIQAAHLPQPGTYRVSAEAHIQGRNVTGEPALFYWPG
jgi:hypothetical protein